MLCIKLVKYCDKYSEMQHGQQTVKKKNTVGLLRHCTMVKREGNVFVYVKYFM